MLDGESKLGRDASEDPVQTGGLLEFGDYGRIHGDIEPQEYDVNLRIPVITVSRGISLPVQKTEVSICAQRIKALRTSVLKMRQIPFAKALSVDQTTVSKWESGKLRPSPEMFLRIAKLATGTEKLFFLEEAGLPPAFLDGTPMTDGMLRASTEMVAESLSEGGNTFRALASPEGQHKVLLLKTNKKLGDAKAVQLQDVDSSLYFPPSWFPDGATVQAVRFPQLISPFISGDVIALVDVSRRDPDRLAGSIVVVQTPTGKEPMTLRKDGSDYLLIPIKEEAGHPARIFRPSGSWSIIGKVLRWIGEAPTGRK